MTYGAYASRDFVVMKRGGPSTFALSHVAFCAATLSLSALAGLWILNRSPAVESYDAMRPVEAPAMPTPASAVLPVRAAALPVPAAVLPVPAAQPAPIPFDPASLAPAYTGYAPVTFEQSIRLASSLEPPPAQEVARLEPPAPAAEPEIVVSKPVETVQSEPVPEPRPARIAEEEEVLPLPPTGRRVVERVAREEVPAPVAPGIAPGRRSIIDKIFGIPQPSSPALAYAAPEEGNALGGMFGARRPAPGTAIYDISAHTVILPNGMRLEAHSGIGPNKDNPRSVTEHMRGATPPAVYALTPREAVFHGVHALRLTPIEGTTYGREGLLAHTYMLGPHGDSNGCVVFRDYQAFLRAYENGQVNRLVVVAGR
jgi:hypothetical protein